jgi:hypothetical protein
MRGAGGVFGEGGGYGESAGVKNAALSEELEAAAGVKNAASRRSSRRPRA